MMPLSPLWSWLLMFALCVLGTTLAWAVVFPHLNGLDHDEDDETIRARDEALTALRNAGAVRFPVPTAPASNLAVGDHTGTAHGIAAAPSGHQVGPYREPFDWERGY